MVIDLKEVAKYLQRRPCGHHPASPVVTWVTNVHYQRRKVIGTAQLTRLQLCLRFPLFLPALKLWISFLHEFLLSEMVHQPFLLLCTN